MKKSRRHGQQGKSLLQMLTLCVLLASLSFLTACGGSQDDDYTPPPATIIRSSDQQMPAPTQVQAQPTEPAAAQPAAPTQAAPPASPYPYPTRSGGGGPVGTPPPGIYPTPATK